MPVKPNQDGSVHAWMNTPFGNFDMVASPTGEVLSSSFIPKDQWKELKHKAAEGGDHRKPHLKTVGGMVTGLPRSGTSLAMRTVDLLGLPIAGMRYPADPSFYKRISDAMELEDEELVAAIEAEHRIYRDKNPSGFYEGGLSDNKLDEKIAKVVIGSLDGIEGCSGAIMVCTRHPSEIAASVKRGTGHGLATASQAQAHYLSHMQSFARWVLKIDSVDRIRAIDYSLAVTQPREYVAAVADLFGVEPNDAAVENVDLSLYRSGIGRSVYDEAEMPVAMESYRRLASVHDYGSARSVALWLRDNAKWIGDHVHDVLSERWSAIPCPRCRDEIRKLNGMSIEQATEQRNEVIAGIVERAKSGAPKWWQRWGASMAPSAAAKIVGECFDEALSRSGRLTA